MSVSPLHIGPVVVDPPIVLAPMAGYTDAAFRAICKRYGCPLMLTEVANGEAIARDCRHTLHLLDTTPGQRPIGAHIYGSNPDAMAQAAVHIEALGAFDFIDINCGCPLRKIVAKGAGAAMMEAPARVQAVVRAIRAAVRLPVTIKTRTGMKDGWPLVHEVAQAAEEGGASAIFLHGRYASEKHSGPVDWERIVRVKQERGIPVVGNGGIESGREAIRVLRETGLDGIMIGRGAVGHPWIFDEARRVALDEAWVPPTPVEMRAAIEQQLKDMFELKRREPKYRTRTAAAVELVTAMHFRAHLVRYLAGCEGLGALRRNMESLKTMADILAATDKVLGTAP